MDKPCKLCPRECGVVRTAEAGLCGGGNEVKIARAALHFWEEPCISGINGSGTVFFSGCSLRCCFCQNYSISAGNFGKEISVRRLADIFLELQEKGAHNINLVTPTHYIPWIICALDIAKPKLYIPVVYNSGGYESVSTLKSIKGYVDIYLPDLKYKDTGLAQKYSGASDYFERASEAICEMFHQVGSPVFDGSGLLQKGMIIRHLVLPGAYRDSLDIFQWISEQFSSEDILVSVMSQYTPVHESGKHNEINRRLTTLEYRKVLKFAQDHNMRGFFQERSSAKEEYTPPFDLEGVEKQTVG